MTNSDIVKLNLKQLGAILSIFIVCAGAIATAAVAWDDANETKDSLVEERKLREEKLHAQDIRLSQIEKELSTWKGVIDERTRIMQENQKVIMADMKKLLENLELVK